MLHALLVPAPHIMAWLTILVELIGGLAVVVGAFIPVASVPLAAVLVVAMLTVHWHYGFNAIKLVAVTAAGPQFGPPGVEVNVLYLACLIALVLGGPGPLAADRLLRRRAAALDMNDDNDPAPRDAWMSPDRHVTNRACSLVVAQQRTSTCRRAST